MRAFRRRFVRHVRWRQTWFVCRWESKMWTTFSLTWTRRSNVRPAELPPQTAPLRSASGRLCNANLLRIANQGDASEDERRVYELSLRAPDFGARNLLFP